MSAKPIITRWSARFDRLTEALGWVSAMLLLALMLIICADVFLRNVPLIKSVRGFPATNDLSEAAIYLITMLSSPWLLRQGRHIRVDIFLRAIPPRAAWCCEWLVDLLGLACCIVIGVFGALATVDAYSSGELVIKALAIPLWWWLVVLPVTFAMLAIEFLFRMHRLAYSPREAREEAVSAA